MNRNYSVVAARAAYRCEYCQAPEAGFNFHFEVEHIPPRSRGGGDDEDNLALACQACNLFKSNCIVAFDGVTENDASLFNPRRQLWEEHFFLNPATNEIQGLTATGRVTIARLRINSNAQLLARQWWIKKGLF